jgi:carbamoyltransferase
MSTTVVGIAAHFHDAACALVHDGELIAAASEERFTRVKYDASTPRHAFRYCLDQAGIGVQDVTCLAYYESPQEKLNRQVWMMLPGISAMNGEIARLDPTRVESDLRRVLGYDGPITYAKHHESHAASSFYHSGFSEAAVLTVDGVGEWATTTYARASVDEGLSIFEEVLFPNSLGLFYSTITSFLGFGVNDGEYKVMGLAPYGTPRYVTQLERLIQPAERGQFRFDLTYFDFKSRKRMYSDALADLLGHAPRPKGSAIDAFHCDLASSVQRLLERFLLDKVRYLHDRVPVDALCMAGGVALNCVANSIIQRQGPFAHVFVQPAAGDAGCAIGAASLVYSTLAGWPRRRRQDHVYLGPSYPNADVQQLLDAVGIAALDCRSSEEQLLSAVVERLAAGKVVGWFQGRMEFGPRSLGARSILADPRDPTMRERINAIVKKREAFRPFAPAVLWERTSEHFDLQEPSPFMLSTCQVISPLTLPAITHVDGSARVQTVHADTNRRFARLLETFERRTGCPILLNTSFNEKDEPIVCTPADALICFLRCNIDTLVIEDFVVDRPGACEQREKILTRKVPLGSAVTHEIYTFL